jgi:hypothetical protein
MKRWARLGGVLGIVYCLAGFFLVFLGWNGAATYDRVEAQIPYVVSGGLGGLGLIIVGAALIVAQSVRADRVQLRDSLEQLREAIERSAAERPVGATPAEASGALAASADDRVVAGPSSYHRATCRVIEGQADVVTMARGEAVASGRTPCRVCAPDSLDLAS